MERIGIRDLRLRASEVLRRVARGEFFEVTDRGRPVARLVPVMPDGLERLELEGRLRPGKGDLLSVRRVPPRPGVPLPSELVSQGRDE